MMDQSPVAVTPVSDAAPFSAERREVALRRINKRGFRWRQIRDWAQSFVIAIGLVIVIRSFLIENFRIPSGSMEHTLLIGDFLLVNKLAYGAEVPFTGQHLPPLERPHRRDIVVFRYPLDLRIHFIKRVVGVPGDTLSMRDGDFGRQRRGPDRALRRAQRRRRRPGRRMVFGGNSRMTCMVRKSAPATARRVTTGGRWSSPRRATSCSATIVTTRRTAATGALYRSRCSKGVQLSCRSVTCWIRRLDFRS